MHKTRLLIDLIDTRFHKNQTAFARAIGRKQAQVNQWISGYRNMSQDTAREIEEKLSLPFGWMDGKSAGQIGEAVPVVGLDPEEDHAAPIGIVKVKTTPSAGETGFPGSQETGEDDLVFFRNGWIISRGYRAGSLMALDIRDDSMEPGLYNGDTILINTADIKPADGKVFALDYEGETIIRRLIRDAGIWWIYSDNQDQRRHPRKEYIDSICIIIGRVVHRQSERI